MSKFTASEKKKIIERVKKQNDRFGFSKKKDNEKK